MPLPDDQVAVLLEGVYDGSISVFELPTFLYAYTVDELDGQIFTGFGGIVRGEVKAIEKAVNFRENVGRFSGAKTWQEVNTLSDVVFLPDGKKRPFAEFAKIGRQIDDTYNLTWLQTEQDSVFSQSQNARKWLKFEGEADIFPILEYVAVGDDRTRPDHIALDGLKRPVNDPIWSKIMPQNGWRCRCNVIQHPPSDITSNSETKRKTRLIKQEFRKNPEFAYNAGKENYIFKEAGKGKHDYFKVPREFQDDLKNNFGFPSVAEVTGRGI